MGIRIQKILWADVRTYCSKFCMLYSALEQDGFYTTAYIMSMRNERFVIEPWFDFEWVCGKSLK